jgi:hypothetical protein
MISNQTPRETWQDMTLNFMTKLPPFKKLIIGIVYDSILIITDRLTKYTYFILYKKSFSAEDLAYIFTKYIMANYGFL